MTRVFKKQGGWEKEFDDLELRTFKSSPPKEIVVNRQQVKDFIRSVLSQHLTTIATEIEKERIWFIKESAIQHGKDNQLEHDAQLIAHTIGEIQSIITRHIKKLEGK